MNPTPKMERAVSQAAAGIETAAAKEPRYAIRWFSLVAVVAILSTMTYFIQRDAREAGAQGINDATRSALEEKSREINEWKVSVRESIEALRRDIQLQSGKIDKMGDRVDRVWEQLKK